MMLNFQRAQAKTLRERLDEPVRWLNIIAGPRRIGKTTLVRAVLGEHFAERCLYASVGQQSEARSISSALDAADYVATHATEVPTEIKADAGWLIRQWKRGRHLAERSSDPFVLAIDEVQKVPRWSETVKALWDEDRANGLAMHVVLLGSSPLLVQRGLTESLMGRFELIRLGHWTYPEMHTAFALSLDEYLYFGGYPEPVKEGIYRNEARWRSFVIDGLIEPSIELDIFDLERVDRRPLLKQLFWLACEYSGQILALDNMARNLREKNEDQEGHTGTVAKYLDMLGKAGLVAGLQKYSGSMLRQRTSPPKLLAQNNALMAVASGYDFAAAKADRSFWGRLVENAVGAHLYNSGDPGLLTYWRKGKLEVDYVLSRGQRLTAIEVKSGNRARSMPGLHAFAATYPGCQRLVVGENGIPLVEFLSQPTEYWLSPR
ncbi:MAG: ATP-binding protein [Sulfuritalea sp.]|nr:ATP-binding protein [Sulfuritalea sp.]